MFMGRTVPQNFGHFKKNAFFILSVFGLYVEPMITFDHFYCIWSYCLVHSQQEKFLNQSYQKMHRRPTATSRINTKLLHIFLI